MICTCEMNKFMIVVKKNHITLPKYILYHNVMGSNKYNKHVIADISTIICFVVYQIATEKYHSYAVYFDS